MIEHFWQKARPHLAAFSPSRWRWNRFLRSLPLNPDALPTPLAPPGPRDVIMCGVPRSGTTLLAAALFQPPRMVTVVEPWDGMRLSPAALFASLRAEIANGHLARGKLDLDTLRSTGTVRWTSEGESPVDLPEMRADYVLGVKWPAYWRFVEKAPEARFIVCVRDPFEVVASFKKEGGQLEKGLMYDTAFNHALHCSLLAATDDLAERRVRLYSEITSRLLPHLDRDNVFVVRYERWAEDPETLIEELGDFLDVEFSPPPVTLRSPKPPKGLTERDVLLIREHALVAKALGYDLNRSVSTI